MQYRSSTPSIRNAQEFEYSCYIGFLIPDIVIRFNTVENDVRTVSSNFHLQTSDRIMDSDQTDIVFKVIESIDDILFATPIFGIQFIPEISIFRGGDREVEGEQYFQWLLHTFVLNLPVKRWWVASAER